MVLEKSARVMAHNAASTDHNPRQNRKKDTSEKAPDMVPNNARSLQQTVKMTDRRDNGEVLYLKRPHNIGPHRRQH